MKQILISLLIAVLFVPAFADKINPGISDYPGYLMAMASKSTGQSGVIPGKTPSKPSKKNGGGVSGWNIAGYTLIGIGAVCGGLGIYYNSLSDASAASAASAYDDYKKASSGFNAYWDTYTSKLNQVKQEQSVRNIFYIAGGVSAGLGLVLALLPSSPAGKNASITVLPGYMAFNYCF